MYRGGKKPKHFGEEVEKRFVMEVENFLAKKKMNIMKAIAILKQQQSDESIKQIYSYHYFIRFKNQHFGDTYMKKSMKYVEDGKYLIHKRDKELANKHRQLVDIIKKEWNTYELKATEIVEKYKLDELFGLTKKQAYYKLLATAKILFQEGVVAPRHKSYFLDKRGDPVTGNVGKKEFCKNVSDFCKKHGVGINRGVAMMYGIDLKTKEGILQAHKLSSRYNTWIGKYAGEIEDMTIRKIFKPKGFTHIQKKALYADIAEVLKKEWDKCEMNKHQLLEFYKIPEKHGVPIEYATSALSNVLVVLKKQGIVKNRPRGWNNLKEYTIL